MSTYCLLPHWALAQHNIRDKWPAEVSLYRKHTQALYKLVLYRRVSKTMTVVCQHVHKDWRLSLVVRQRIGLWVCLGFVRIGVLVVMVQINIVINGSMVGFAC